MPRFDTGSAVDPVTCGLHGEDIFIEGIPQAYQEETLAIIRERSGDVDRFLAISKYYGEMFSNWVGLDRSKIDVVWPGIALNGSTRPRVVCYILRMIVLT